jgi:peroxiredoxin Q/BCP
VAEVSEGARAPQFTLPAVNVEKIGMEGGTIALNDLKGDRIVVLYFYPRDNTSGCTVEAVGFRDLKGQFTRNGAVILGVSTDDLDTHTRSSSRSRSSTSRCCPMRAERSRRSTVYCGEEDVREDRHGHGALDLRNRQETGRSRSIWPKVSPEGHAAEVLECREVDGLERAPGRSGRRVAGGDGSDRSRRRLSSRSTSADALLPPVSAAAANTKLREVSWISRPDRASWCCCATSFRSPA